MQSNIPIEIAKLDDREVTKSNSLILASYAMTLNEQRIILACISQIDSKTRLKEGAEFTLTVEAAKKIFYEESNERNAYRDLEEASKRLFERKVKILLPTGEVLETRFVSSNIFDKKKMQVTIEFAPKIVPFLSNLEHSYTKYRLANMTKLRSSYAIRIYELLVLWWDQGFVNKAIFIDELRGLLQLENKYRQLSEFRRRVIEPSIDQINEFTDFMVEIEFSKRNRTKIKDTIIFIFENKFQDSTAQQIEKSKKKQQKQRSFDL